MSILKDRLQQQTCGDDTLLYHYTSLASACKIIENNTLKLSNLVNTNDPLEFLSGEPSSFSAWGDIDYKKIFRELTISKKNRINFVRMICFCKDMFCSNKDWQNEKIQDFADNLLFKGWARSRMWAQYADNHSGVCLVFDKADFQKHFNSLASNDIEVLPDRDIDYTNYLTELETSMSDINASRPLLDDYSDFYLGDDKKKYLFQKCQDYRDENEYRFCLINRSLKSPDESMFVDYGSSLKAIILGQRFSYSLKIELPNEVELFRIRWEYGRPSLW